MFFRKKLVNKFIITFPDGEIFINLDKVEMIEFKKNEINFYFSTFCKKFACDDEDYSDIKEKISKIWSLN